MQHPSDQQLQLLLDAKLDAEEANTIELHLNGCPQCSHRIIGLERTGRDYRSLERYANGTSNLLSVSSLHGKTIGSLNELAVASPPFVEGIVLTGNLRLEKKLGRGGMGDAWQASDLIANRHVVVKLIPPEIRHVKDAMDQVRETFKKVHALQHQHICPMLNLIDDPTYGFFVVMKYIRGKTLDNYRANYISRHGRFTHAEIIKILWDVARALDYSHDRNVLHRDVKPQNIMISKEDGVQLIDFGLAAEIRSSMLHLDEAPMDVSGTRPYMAPEQWQGRLQDSQTDQYALAVTAYELFAGYRPFREREVTKLRESVLNEAPPPLENVPAYINAALLKALSKQRTDRFPDCKSFVKALAEMPKTEVPKTEPTDAETVKAETTETETVKANTGKPEAVDTAKIDTAKIEIVSAVPPPKRQPEVSPQPLPAQTSKPIVVAQPRTRTSAAVAVPPIAIQPTPLPIANPSQNNVDSQRKVLIIALIVLLFCAIVLFGAIVLVLSHQKSNQAQESQVQLMGEHSLIVASSQA